MGDIRTVYVDATGIWWKLKWRALVEAVANVFLCLVLIAFFQVRGAIVALLISLFVCNFLYGSHLTFVHYFGIDKAGRYYLDHFQYLALGVVVCVVTYSVTSAIPSQSISFFVLRALAAAVCSCAFVVVLLFKTKRFKHAWQFVRSLKGES